MGTGKCFNGGNGILLDGSERIDWVVASGLDWDVMGGVARRAWARNPNALETVARWNERMAGEGHITEPEVADESVVGRAVDEVLKKK